MTHDRHRPALHLPAPNLTDATGQPGPTTLEPSPPCPGPYPELIPVISLAVDAVVYTFDIDEHADRMLIKQLTRIVTDTALDLYAPMAAIVAQAEEASLRSRKIRAAEVARAAQAMAIRVADIAAALQVPHEAQAVTLARDASDAAALVASADIDQADPRAAATAAQVVAVVRVAAATAVRDRATAAALVARTAASAATEVAQAAECENVALQLEAASTAAAVRAIALDTCYQAAIDVAATAAELALRNRTAG